MVMPCMRDGSFLVERADRSDMNDREANVLLLLGVLVVDIAFKIKVAMHMEPRLRGSITSSDLAAFQYGWWEGGLGTRGLIISTLRVIAALASSEETNDSLGP